MRNENTAEEKLVDLETLKKEFETVGKELFVECSGQLFPADILFIASCNRALQVLDSFTLLMRNNHYSCSVALLRLQLDTILRLYGITKTADIHETANSVIAGEKLSNMRDKAGKKLVDGYLVELLTEINPWFKHVYSTCCGYIHFSDTSYYHLIMQSEINSDSNARMFYIGSNESNIEDRRKIELIKGFIVATEGIQKLVKEWTTKRVYSGTYEELVKRYSPID